MDEVKILISPVVLRVMTGRTVEMIVMFPVGCYGNLRRGRGDKSDKEG